MDTSNDPSIPNEKKIIKIHTKKKWMEKYHSRFDIKALINDISISNAILDADIPVTLISESLMKRLGWNKTDLNIEGQVFKRGLDSRSKNQFFGKNVSITIENFDNFEFETVAYLYPNLDGDFGIDLVFGFKYERGSDFFEKNYLNFVKHLKKHDKTFEENVIKHLRKHANIHLNRGDLDWEKIYNPKSFSYILHYLRSYLNRNVNIKESFFTPTKSMEKIQFSVKDIEICEYQFSEIELGKLKLNLRDIDEMQNYLFTGLLTNLSLHVGGSCRDCNEITGNCSKCNNGNLYGEFSITMFNEKPITVTICNEKISQCFGIPLPNLIEMAKDPKFSLDSYLLSMYTLHPFVFEAARDYIEKGKFKSSFLRCTDFRSIVSYCEMEKKIDFALSELDRMVSILALPKTLRDIAVKIYQSAVKSHLIKGRSIEGIAAASLYAACRMTKIPRTLQEIAETSRVDKKEIDSSYRYIVARLNLNSNPEELIDYIARFVSELNLSSHVQKKAKENEIIKPCSEKNDKKSH